MLRDSTLEPLMLLSRTPYADRTFRCDGASYAHVRRTASVTLPSQDARRLADDARERALALGKALREQGAPRLRFSTCLRTAAVRFAW